MNEMFPKLCIMRLNDILILLFVYTKYVPIVYNITTSNYNNEYKKF